MPMSEINDYLALGLKPYTGWDKGYLAFSVAPVEGRLRRRIRKGRSLATRMGEQKDRSRMLSRGLQGLLQQKVHNETDSDFSQKGTKDRVSKRRLLH
jgi:hypothetical protein